MLDLQALFPETTPLRSIAIEFRALALISVPTVKENPQVVFGARLLSTAPPGFLPLQLAAQGIDVRELAWTCIRPLLLKLPPASAGDCNVASTHHLLICTCLGVWMGRYSKYGPGVPSMLKTVRKS